MKHNLALSRRAFFAPEFVLVVLLAFGLFCAASVKALFGPLTGPAAELFGNERAWTLASYQLAVAPIIAYVLWKGGWSWRHFAIHPTARGLLHGFGLAAVALVLSKLALALVAPGSATSALAAPAATFGFAGLLLAAIVAPLFEELLLCSYIVHSLGGRFGVVMATHVSIALRISMHLYQGPSAFLAYAIIGLVFTLFYVRTGRLWPVVVAHALLEAFAA